MSNSDNTTVTPPENSGKEETFERTLENGCKAHVCARESENGDIDLLVCVYSEGGETVMKRTTTLPGSQWTVHDALKRGIDRAERVAGGESGRLPCADRADSDDDDGQ